MKKFSAVVRAFPFRATAMDTCRVNLHLASITFIGLRIIRRK